MEAQISDDVLQERKYGDDVNMLWEGSCRGISEAEYVCGLKKVESGRGGDACWIWRQRKDQKVKKSVEEIFIK